jgi:hypothetical protein
LSAEDGEETWVRAALGGALMGIGKRNRKLNQAAIRAAKAIGPIDYGDDNCCEPLDVLKHLTSDYLKNQLDGMLRRLPVRRESARRVWSQVAGGARTSSASLQRHRLEVAEVWLSSSLSPALFRWPNWPYTTSSNIRIRDAMNRLLSLSSSSGE